MPPVPPRLRQSHWAAASVGAALCLLAPAIAEAQCSIQTTAAAFGTYNVFNTSPQDTTATVSYNCATRVDVTITLSRGNSPTFDRYLLVGSDQLLYNLYTNSNRSRIWGDGTGGTYVYTRNNAPANQWIAVTVYGRIPASQDAAAGTYTDNVVATIIY